MKRAWMLETIRRVVDMRAALNAGDAAKIVRTSRGSRSVRKFAVKMDVSPTYVSQIENGGPISFGFLERVLREGHRIGA